MKSLQIYDRLLEFSNSDTYKFIDFIMGFEACCVCIGLFIAYYAKILIDRKIRERETENIVEKAVIISIVDLTAAILLSFGLWKNTWLVGNLGWTSFDTMFNLIAIILSAISLFVVICAYYGLNLLAAWSMFITLIPLVTLCSAGYARMIRGWAEHK